MIFVIGGAFQGQNEYAENEFGNKYSIVSDYHIKVREDIEKGKDPFKEAEKLLNKNSNIVITSNELGLGLVPADKAEREYREINGRVNCMFAERAEKVIRVICGIGESIK